MPRATWACATWGSRCDASEASELILSTIASGRKRVMTVVATRSVVTPTMQNNSLPKSGRQEQITNRRMRFARHQATLGTWQTENHTRVNALTAVSNSGMPGEALVGRNTFGKSMASQPKPHSTER